MTRMAIGFVLASANMVIAAILQWRVYETSYDFYLSPNRSSLTFEYLSRSPCGYQATTDCAIGSGVSPVSLWWQIPLYSLPAIAEILINVSFLRFSFPRFDILLSLFSIVGDLIRNVSFLIRIPGELRRERC